MFETLSDKLQGVFGRLRKSGRTLGEKDVSESLRTIRVALLEADVALEVVKSFISSIREKAVGEAVISSVRPGEQIVKIVQDELEALMGESDTSIPYRNDGRPTVILMSGLQGSGKTTTCGKLALLLSRRDKRKPLLVAADLQRPAAVQQLKTIGKQLGVPVFSQDNQKPVQVCEAALAHAKANGLDLVILDTAGRLHIDEELMREIRAIHKVTSPDQTYLVCDAMTGQDAVQSARSFHETLPLDGVILTKLDGDTRGGAALSLRHVTGRPIKFAGMGEQLDKLEEFHPKRMAGRILGMGDVVSLVEKAQEAISEKEALELQDKLLKNQFTLHDFLNQLQMVKKMGSIKDLIGMLPGIGNAVKDMDIDEKQFSRVEALIQSMTPAERQKPDLLDGSRRKRISAGAGQHVQALNQFMDQYRGMQKMMAGMNKKGGIFSGMKNLFGKGAMKDLAGPAEGKGDIPMTPSPPMDQASRKLQKQLRRDLKAKRRRSRGR